MINRLVDINIPYQIQHQFCVLINNCLYEFSFSFFAFGGANQRSATGLDFRNIFLDRISGLDFETKFPDWNRFSNLDLDCGLYRIKFLPDC